MCKNISIAVVDDGINEKLYNLDYLKFNIQITSSLQIRDREKYNPCLSSHGTTCAAIIKKYSPDAPLGSIKILNDNSKRAVKYQLIKSLEWCVNNNIKIISLSLGTIDYRDFDEIKKCINKAAEQGVIIIAACNNTNVYTVPACLTNVIGVKCRKLYIDDQYKYNSYAFDGIDISASGRHFLTDMFGDSRNTSPSNSFAAPLITAKVYNIVKEDPSISLEEIKKKLYEGAMNCKEAYNAFICISTDWMNEIVYEKQLDFNEINMKDIRSKLWNPILYEKVIAKNLTSKVEINVPIILIYDTRINHSKSILKELNMLFREDGYYSVTVSTELEDVYIGAEYLPFEIDCKVLLSNVNKKYNGDVILLRVKGKEFLKRIEKKVECDIILQVSDIEESKIIIKDSSDRKYIPIICDTKLTQVQIKDVYKNIINCFERE